MSNNETIQHADLQPVVEALVHGCASDPVLRNGLLLAWAKGYGHAQTLQILAALTSPLPTVRWDLLGNPSAAACSVMVDKVTQAAASLEAQQVPATMAAQPCGALPDLLVYAALHTAAPMTLDDVAAVLGPTAVAGRLRHFAQTLQAATMVG